MNCKLKDRLIIIVFALVLLSVGFAGGQYYLHRIYQRQIEVSYRRALSEFATHLQELTIELGRSRLAQSDPLRDSIGADLRRLVYAAQSNMGELPLGEIQTERIAGLLAQAYKYSFLFNPEQAERLYQQAGRVSRGLQNILVQKEKEFPWVSWREYLGARLTFGDLLQTLATINNDLDEFKIPLRKGEIEGEIISPQEAVSQAQAFSGKQELDFKVTKESRGSPPTYTVEAQGEEQHLIVEVSQKGGVVLWMATVQTIEEQRLTSRELIQFGNSFLLEKGFPPMHVTDLQLLQNKATLTFVPVRDGILRYAEPVKVQISAADGAILGFWGVPYYLAQSRSGQPLERTAEQEWELEDKIKRGVEVLDQKLALILNGKQEEILTARLGVQYGEEYYLIYLNFESGAEEDLVPVASPEFF